MQPGQYGLVVKVEYGDTIAQASDTFVVSGVAEALLTGNATVNISTIVFTLVALFGVALVIMYVEHHLVELQVGSIKQVTEDDFH